MDFDVERCGHGPFHRNRYCGCGRIIFPRFLGKGFAVDGYFGWLYIYKVNLESQFLHVGCAVICTLGGDINVYAFD